MVLLFYSGKEEPFVVNNKMPIEKAECEKPATFVRSDIGKRDRKSIWIYSYNHFRR